MRSILVAIALLSPSLNCADPIDDLLKKAMVADHIPGVSIAVLKDGRVVKESGYGFAELENQVRAKPTTVYELASISKQFTAVGTMMLVEEGKIALDDPVNKYFPEAPESWSTMRIRNLLNHTSGLIEFHFDPNRLSALSFFRYKDEQQIKDMAKSRLLFEPGTKMSYSNAGYCLLGILIQRVSNQPLDIFLKERIFTPLQMHQTEIGDGTTVMPNMAGEYTWRNGHWAPWRLLTTLGSLNTNGFGGIVSSVKDLERWEVALEQGKLLKPESWRQIWTPGKLNNGAVVADYDGPYGFGWHVLSMPYGVEETHTGYTGTYIARVPGRQVAVILLTNHGDGNPRLFSKDEGFNVHKLGQSVLEMALAKYK